MVKPEPIYSERDIASATPVFREYMGIKNDNPDSMVGFQVGDFYEFYDDDARRLSALLNFTLTKKPNAAATPMAGWPLCNTAANAAKLIAAGASLVLCDQYDDAAGVKKRRPTRWMTPGTTLDEGSLDGRQSRVLGSVLKKGRTIHAAWLDLGQGDILWQSFSFQGFLDHLAAEPWAETLIPESQASFWAGLLSSSGARWADESASDLEDASDTLNEAGPGDKEGLAAETTKPEAPQDRQIFGGHVSPLPAALFDPLLTEGLLSSVYGKFFKSRFDLTGSAGTCATQLVGALLGYIQKTQGAIPQHLDHVGHASSRNVLGLSGQTLSHLEVLQSRDAAAGLSMHGTADDSLLKTLDQCSTLFGSRLLRRWLTAPSRDVSLIRSRQDRVAALMDPEIHLTWRALASEWADLERIQARLGLQQITPKDWVGLRMTLRSMVRLDAWAKRLPGALKGFAPKTGGVAGILKLLEQTLAAEPTMNVKQGGMIAKGANTELDEQKHLLLHQEETLKELEKEVKLRTGLAQLRLCATPSGFYAALSRSVANKDVVLPTFFSRLQGTKNEDRYTFSELRLLEEKIGMAEQKALRIESELMGDLLTHVLRDLPALTLLTRQLAEWDVLNALATAAHDHQWRRPEFLAPEQGHGEPEMPLTMIQGRHPVIERQVAHFVPNDLHLGGDPRRLEDSGPGLVVITGPNMGGKSTVMRQVALLVILAHMGSFVPAQTFRLPVMDAVHTRIGAQDNLGRGQSTFMVEMSETAQILRRATSRSLVLLDELGRGTSTFDGLSLARSVALFLARHTRAKTLFATHYLEMTQLATDFPELGFGNLHVEAVEDQRGSVTFTHVLKPGAALQSFGIHVAQMAGLPAEVLRDATSYLRDMEGSILHQRREAANLVDEAKAGEKSVPFKGGLKGGSELGSQGSDDALRQSLLALNISTMTPVKALLWLAEQQENLQALTGGRG